MQPVNRTTITEFILLGLTDEPGLQIPLFLFFFIVYLISILENFGIMALIVVTRTMHKPMYLFLCNLAFADIVLSSVNTPVMLVHFLSERKSISFGGCVTQMFITYAIGSTEDFLLAVMAYDRYIAICNPLLYPAIMTNRACVYFVVFIYVIAILNALTHAVFTFTLPFCGSNEITHFFCDIPAILKLSCSDTTLNELVLVYVAGGLILISFISVIVSYTLIISAILKIRSSDGKSRAFSTCSSHFICVFLYFGTLVFMYVKPPSSHSMDQDRVVSVVDTQVIPMLNPLIYSLRNKEVKAAIINVMRKTSVLR